MNRPLIIRPEAERDLSEAHDWYELRVPGLGSDFLLSIDTALSSIQQTPELYATLWKNVRRVLIRRFPYGIFYLVEEARIVVIAVMHARRDPETWRRRV
jgi:plasmid stabilization system protein ParE